MNISGDAGHNASPDIGASSIKKEDVLTKELVGLVAQKLRILGHTFTDCTPYGQKFSGVSGSLDYRCKVANASGSVLHICIHFNAGGGHGVEVFAMSPKGREFAQKVCSEIANLGFTNRGVKDGSSLFMVKYPTMPSILIECAFVDSSEDMSRYSAENMSNAIVKAITGQDYKANNIERKVDSMSILELQRFCNRLGATDQEGKSLVEDNQDGKRTQSAKAKLKAMLQYVIA